MLELKGSCLYCDLQVADLLIHQPPVFPRPDSGVPEIVSSDLSLGEKSLKKGIFGKFSEHNGEGCLLNPKTLVINHSPKKT